MGGEDLPGRGDAFDPLTPASGPTTHTGGVFVVGPEEFEELVGEALDAIPEQLSRQMRNVVLLVEDMGASPNLLGLYQGVPLTERTTAYAGMLPDRITIYRIPILRHCNSRDDVVRQVAVTVIHEVAHHFGIGDAKLHELGWG
jgi:predicted Zn-dependent protease with MMP-like domain